MRNTEIIRKLRRLHTLLVLSKRSNVLALALRRALEFIATWRDEADTILKKTPVKVLFAGYGPKFIKIFDELIQTGNIALIDKLQPEFDPFFCYLCEIPSIGETMARRMFFERSIRTMDDLRIAYSNNILQKIPAFGESRLKVIEEILWQTQGQAGFEPMPSFTFQYTEPSKTNLKSSDSSSRQLALALDHTVDYSEDAGDDENLSNDISSMFARSIPQTLPLSASAEANSPIYQQVKTPSGSSRKPSSETRTPSRTQSSEQKRPSSGALEFGRKPRIVKAKSEPSLFPSLTSSESLTAEKQADSRPSLEKTDEQAMINSDFNHGEVTAILDNLFGMLALRPSQSTTENAVRWLVSRCTYAPKSDNCTVSAYYQRLISALPASRIFFSDNANRFGGPVVVLCDNSGCGILLTLGIPDVQSAGAVGDLQLSALTPQKIDMIEQLLQETAQNALQRIELQSLTKLLRMLGLNEIVSFGVGFLEKFCAVFSVSEAPRQF